jgi:hypothetical protein
LSGEIKSNPIGVEQSINTLLHRPKIPPEVRDDSQLAQATQASGRFLEKSHKHLDSLVDELDNALI